MSSDRELLARPPQRSGLGPRLRRRVMRCLPPLCISPFQTEDKSAPSRAASHASRRGPAQVCQRQLDPIRLQPRRGAPPSQPSLTPRPLPRTRQEPSRPLRSRAPHSPQASTCSTPGRLSSSVRRPLPRTLASPARPQPLPPPLPERTPTRLFPSLPRRCGVRPPVLGDLPRRRSRPQVRPLRPLRRCATKAKLIPIPPTARLSDALLCRPRCRRSAVAAALPPSWEHALAAIAQLGAPAAASRAEL